MERLPIFTDAAEAIEFYEATPSSWSSNLMKAWVVRHLVEDGYANADIRDALKIRKKYVVTHLIRVGKSLSLEEFQLWAQYPVSITFGHMRAIASLPYPTRRDLLKLLLKTKTTVSQLEQIARGKKLDNETDIRKLERDISDHTGQPTRIRFNHKKKSGSITVDFFSLDEFDFLCEKLGYKPSDDF
ncbi:MULTISPECIES: hypothetical protein [Marinobacter]|uniref:Transcriptional regulator n=3 Tax=Marinobacter TaxID=2742 RepID=W5YUA5_9GAMM|nr:MULTISPECIES: hypothetical protein [Marinobacter]HIO01009.1 transcriptional regulator [Alphaproteobacteria bacterium]AHI32721.1 transcriptional regulator [Marinobacter salarius]AZR43509.1 hypothetical protein MTMN5_04084 [Marinobacter salarius]MBL3558810.1 transcriptional regulator [Marinobacter sp. JB05H06]MCD1649662.1 transcriptional regulator [Marinobacter adhaerens]